MLATITLCAGSFAIGYAIGRRRCLGASYKKLGQRVSQLIVETKQAHVANELAKQDWSQCQ
jgi:hypothetical protein